MMTRVTSSDKEFLGKWVIWAESFTGCVDGIGIMPDNWPPQELLGSFRMAKKLKNEKALLKLALDMILADAVKRGVVEFDATDSHDLKIEYAYRLLVHDKEIAPLPNAQLSMPNIRHRLAMWVTHKLPADHELLG
jgi:hypothetical protein